MKASFVIITALLGCALLVEANHRRSEPGNDFEHDHDDRKDVQFQEFPGGYTLTFQNSETCNASGIAHQTTTVMNVFCPTSESGTSDSFDVFATYQLDNCTTVINATSKFACPNFVHHVSMWLHITSWTFGLVVFAFALLIVVCVVRRVRKCCLRRKQCRQARAQELTALLSTSRSAPQPEQVFVPIPMQQPYQQFAPMYPPFMPPPQQQHQQPRPAVPSGVPHVSDEQLARALQAEYNTRMV